MHSADGFFKDLVSNKEGTVSIALSLFMLQKILAISNETKISWPDKFLFVIWTIKSNKCNVSFVTFGMFGVEGVQMLSINLSKF